MDSLSFVNQGIRRWFTLDEKITMECKDAEGSMKQRWVLETKRDPGSFGVESKGVDCI
jgi:hypothetical protein